MQKQPGIYLGTEVEGKWWRRYSKPPFFARGNGTYWVDDRAFYFHRHLTRSPLELALERIQEIQVGRWHAGRWAGGAPVVKLIWVEDSLSLSSGFVLSRSESQTRKVIQALEHRAERADRRPSVDQIRRLGYEWPKHPLIAEYAVLEKDRLDLAATLEKLRASRAFYRGQLDEAFAFKQSTGADYADFTDRFDEYALQERQLRQAIAYLSEIAEALAS